MRNIFILLIMALALQIGCKTETSNQNNSNLSTPTPASNSNTNVTAQSTPLPEFSDAETALAEGKKQLDAGDTQKSIEALRQAVKLSPEMAEAYFNLGIAYALAEKEREISQTVTEEPTPTPSKARKTKKNEFVPETDSDKAFDKAAQLYEKAAKKNPKDDQVLYNLGRAYNKINKDTESEKALLQAVKLKPEDAEYQVELGAIQIKLAHYDRAVVALKKAISLDPENIYAEELLEKAEAGVKRINYGDKPKPTPQTATGGKAKITNPNQRPTPQLKIENAPIRKPGQ